MRRLLLLAAVCASSGVQPAHARRTELRTELITQQTPSWCWAASASMALELLRFPDINEASNYQCGVVAAAFPSCGDDCTRCDMTLPTMVSLIEVLNRYREHASPQRLSGLQASFSPNYLPNPDFKSVRQSLDASFPVLGGISPDETPTDPAASEHAVLLTGYDEDYLGTGEPWIVVRDPYPYAAGENPWINAGYPFWRASGRALVPWRALRQRMNLTSAVFLAKLG